MINEKELISKLEDLAKKNSECGIGAKDAGDKYDHVYYIGQETGVKDAIIAIYNIMDENNIRN